MQGRFSFVGVLLVRRKNSHFSDETAMNACLSNNTQECTLVEARHFIEYLELRLHCSEAFRMRHIEVIRLLGCFQNHCHFSQMYLVTCIGSMVRLHGSATLVKCVIIRLLDSFLFACVL